jgi:hypothetical protein
MTWGLKIVALRQQLVVLSGGLNGRTWTVPIDSSGFFCAECGRSGRIRF